MSRNPTIEDLTSLDYGILKVLPDEGTKVGYSDIALQVRTILQKPGFEATNGTQIGGRLNSLRFLGLVVPVKVPPVGLGFGWQRTAAGKEALENGGQS